MTLYQAVDSKNFATQENHEGYAQLALEKQRCQLVMQPVAGIMSIMEHWKQMEVVEAKKLSKSRRDFHNGREYMQSPPGISSSNA